jgi:hypothetical protein
LKDKEPNLVSYKQCYILSPKEKKRNEKKRKEKKRKENAPQIGTR